VRIARLFTSGQSQAVELPKEFHFEGSEVLIKQVGEAVVLLPVGRPWGSLIGSLEKFPEDFLEFRYQPDISERRGSPG